MSRYCMIYFGYPPIKGFQFLEQILYKKSDIKILFIVIISWTIIWHFRKKNKNGVTRLIIFQEGQSYPHPYKFRGYLKKIKECNFCHLYYSIFLVRGNFALQEEKRKKKTICYKCPPWIRPGSSGSKVWHAKHKARMSSRAHLEITRASINFQIQEVQTSYPWNLEVPLNFFWKSQFFSVIPTRCGGLSNLLWKIR